MNSFLKQISIESVFDELPIGIVFLYQNGEILDSNSSFNKIVCETQQKNLHQYIWSVIIDDSASTKKQLIQNNYEYKIKTFNNQFLYLKTKKTEANQKGDEIFIGLLSGKENISKLGAELERKNSIIGDIEEELEHETELSDMKSRFLAIASHEFRTPLAGILSSINLINRYKMAEISTWKKISNHEKIENHLNKVKKSVKNLTSLINKFLALRNITKGEIPVKKTKFDIQLLLNNQKEQLQEICKPGQRISYKHDGEKTEIELDSHLMKNIINNLLSNAIKYSHENTTIRMRSSINQNEFKISIEDQGIGIPLKEQNKIYSRFYRAKNALKFDEGTGLGLNLVKNYVEIMNGNIEFESEENRGSTFLIIFPLNTNK